MDLPDPPVRRVLAVALATALLLTVAADPVATAQDATDPDATALDATALDATALDATALLTSGAVRPVPGAVVRPFAPPAMPFGPGHRGVDLAARPAEPVRAALAGTVTFAGQVAGVGYVTLDHGGGLRTTYGDVVASVDTGDDVPAGGRIGSLGAAATHLDWGARLDDDYVDPLSLLARWTVRLTSLDVPRGDVVTVEG